jgi:(E)-4-hydroxy-3-methylbut-2-enyl-diphosphate synthase
MEALKIVRRNTRAVKVGDLTIGSGAPISTQSMCATKTQDIERTLAQIRLLESKNADIIRVAVDSKRDVEALAEIRKKTKARLVVDLQESYRLAKMIAPFVQKIRYNPGHLHHHEKNIPVKDKVKYIVDCAREHGCAVRIGVNFGSLDPNHHENESPMNVALRSASEHIEIMDSLGFDQFVVSMKSSDPNDVIDINRQFCKIFPDIPLHLGVTEAGMLPMGEIKTRIAFENLLVEGIGDTLRVSLTLPFEEKYREIEVAKAIVNDVYAGRFRSVPRFIQDGMNIISCPSCSRVENEAFVQLAQKIREVSDYAKSKNITIAVMGCRVNGPGETDDADIGLWCAPNHVNLKRGTQVVGAFSYEEIITNFLKLLDKVVMEKNITV